MVSLVVHRVLLHNSVAQLLALWILQRIVAFCVELLKPSSMEAATVELDINRHLKEPAVLSVDLTKFQITTSIALVKMDIPTAQAFVQEYAASMKFHQITSIVIAFQDLQEIALESVHAQSTRFLLLINAFVLETILERPTDVF